MNARFNTLVLMSKTKEEALKLLEKESPLEWDFKHIGVSTGPAMGDNTVVVLKRKS